MAPNLTLRAILHARATFCRLAWSAWHAFGLAANLARFYFPRLGCDLILVAHNKAFRGSHVTLLA
ncbi:hypothetical protein Csa_021206 [Cucumis sativus]|uniref:Uncharacterized protein n=1 Tax=Cucumis sativus TaxID=3659 RepID=A0A0A0LH86_CUCSA|nr:hypothetical protein Csa_021206 [Cucumis sativus]